jgi:hypothetical protein
MIKMVKNSGLTTSNATFQWETQKFGVIMPLFCLFDTFSTYIQSITFIQNIHLSPFAEVPLYLLIAGQISGKKFPGGVEPRVEHGPALQQADVLVNTI